MLAGSADTAAYDELVQRRTSPTWRPEMGPWLVVFSNAALHWLPDHRRSLVAAAWPGWWRRAGTLAVQMPRQFDAPSHRLIRDVAARLFAGAVSTGPGRLRRLADARRLCRGCSGRRSAARRLLGRREYRPAACRPPTAEHPVRRFTASRRPCGPFAGPSWNRSETVRAFARRRMTPHLAQAYPLLSRIGAVLMPFSAAVLRASAEIRRADHCRTEVPCPR